MALAVSGVNQVLNSRGLYAGGIVEPHPDFGVGLAGNKRYLLQCAGGLWCAQRGTKSRTADHFVSQFRSC